MKKTRIAINGAGRIGRAFYKLAKERDEVEVVAFNDLGNIENIAYLLKHDTAHGLSDFNVEVEGDKLVIDGSEVSFLSEKEPEKLPWKEMEIDIVIEATGVFTKYELAKKHLTAGAKRVVISAPAKDEPTDNEKEATILMGINDSKLETCEVTSNASCTTNAGSPLMAILDESLGVEKALLNTVHGYTATQSIVDGPSKDFRKGRAGAQNIIPSTTGAAIAVTKALPQLENNFDGISVRVPVIVGSLVDITFVSKKETTEEEVKDILRKASNEDRWKGIFRATDEPIVSSDIIGDTHASIADLGFVRVVGGNLVKVLAWYDNETGYTNSLLEHAIKLGSYIK